MEKALEEHHWPKALANKMPEYRRSYIDDVVEELFGLRPPSWVLVPQVAETTLRLAAAGHVILVGRGATVVTARLPNVFHVRLIASLPRRIERVQRIHGLSPELVAISMAPTEVGTVCFTRRLFRRRDALCNPRPAHSVSPHVLAPKTGEPDTGLLDLYGRAGHHHAGRHTLASGREPMAFAREPGLVPDRLRALFLGG